MVVVRFNALTVVFLPMLTILFSRLLHAFHCNSITHRTKQSTKSTQWGTWKAGVSLLNTGIRHPGSVMKNVIPIVMAGVIGIYGLIIAVILAGNIPTPTVGTRENVYSIYTGMAHVSEEWMRA